MKKTHIIYIIIAILFISFTLPATTGAASKMPDGTTIAHVNVEKKTDDEIAQLLENEITIWKAQDDIVLSGEFENMTVSREAFQFDIDATINELKQKTKRSLMKFFMRPKNVNILMEVKVDESHSDIQALFNKSYIDHQAVIEQLTSLAANFQSGDVSLVYVEGEDVPLETIAELKWDVPDLSQATLQYIVDEIDGEIIPYNGLFSFLEAVESPERLMNSRDESSFVASALYTLFLQANVEIVERHPQLTLPSYGNKGVNAEVNKRDEKDLIILNNNFTSYSLSLSLSNNELVAKLEGAQTSDRYEIKVENEKEIKARTIYRYSKNVNLGESVLVQAGENGVAIDIYRSVYENGSFVDDVLISKDLYLPKPRIVLVSAELEEIEGEGGEDDINIGIEGEDGSSGGLADRRDPLTDLLPDDLQGTDEFDRITDLDRRQQSYQEFLDRLLEEYQQSPDETVLQQIQAVSEQMTQTNKLLEDLIKDLIAKDLLEQDFLDSRKDGAQ